MAFLVVSFPAGAPEGRAGEGNPQRALRWIPFPALRAAGDDTGDVRQKGQVQANQGSPLQ